MRLDGNMRILTKIITVISICFVIATVAISYQVFNSPSELDCPYLEFNMNVYDKTLTVSKIDNFDYNWEDITLYSGVANLPSSGKISVDDVITNCYGTIKFRLPNDSVLGSWPFNEKPEDIFEDIRFNDVWGNANQELQFFENGSYYNSFHSINIGDSDSSLEEYEIVQGKYEYKDDELVFNEVDSGAGAQTFAFSVILSNADTQLDIYNDYYAINWTLQRSFNDTNLLNILKTTEKLDDCLTSFIANYSNSSYKENLSNGLNVMVILNDFLTQGEVDNLSMLGIYFNTDNNGNIYLTNYNLSIKIDSLQDLYYLVSRSDVEQIFACDTKFLTLGCNNIIC